MIKKNWCCVCTQLSMIVYDSVKSSRCGATHEVCPRNTAKVRYSRISPSETCLGTVAGARMRQVHSPTKTPAMYSRLISTDGNGQERRPGTQERWGSRPVWEHRRGGGGGRAMDATCYKKPSHLRDNLNIAAFSSADQLFVRGVRFHRRALLKGPT